MRNITEVELQRNTEQSQGREINRTETFEKYSFIKFFGQSHSKVDFQALGISLHIKIHSTCNSIVSPTTPIPIPEHLLNNPALFARGIGHHATHSHLLIKTRKPVRVLHKPPSQNPHSPPRSSDFQVEFSVEKHLFTTILSRFTP